MATKKIKGSLSIENVLELPNYTASRVLTIGSGGAAEVSTVTPSELSQLSGISSAVLQASDKDVANGVAGLDGSGKLSTSTLPGLALTEVNVVASEAAMIALIAQEGDLAIRTDVSKTFVHNGGVAGTAADWTELFTPTNSVSSVFGRTGVVTAQSGDYSASQVSATPAGPFVGSDVQSIINELGNTYIPDAIITTAGDLMIGASGSGDASRLGIGSEGQVLTVSSGAPVWSSPASAPTDFSDDVFRISDNLDSSKKISFEASSISAATVRSITMPDANVDLGLVNSATQPGDNISSLTNDSAFVDAAGVRSTVLTGFSLANATDVVATDTVVQAFGKLQRQLDNVSAGAASALSDLSDVSVTTPSNGQILIYDDAGAGQFVNATMQAGEGIIVNSSAGNIQVFPDISNATDLASFRVANNDEVLIYDVSASQHRKTDLRSISGRSVGDKEEYEFAVDASLSATPVTVTQFSNSDVRSFECHICFEATTNGGTPLVEYFKVMAVSKSLAGESAAWTYIVESIGDDSGIDLTVSNTGQLQYACPSGITNYDNNGSFRLRATTTSTASAHDGDGV